MHPTATAGTISPDLPSSIVLIVLPLLGVLSSIVPEKPGRHKGAFFFDNLRKQLSAQKRGDRRDGLDAEFFKGVFGKLR
jgi:hypothetical protein